MLPGVTWIIICHLVQESGDIICKLSDNKHFRLYRTCGKYWTLPPRRESSQWWYKSWWEWQCSNQSLGTEPGCSLDRVHEPSCSVLTPDLVGSQLGGKALLNITKSQTFWNKETSKAILFHLFIFNLVRKVSSRGTRCPISYSPFLKYLASSQIIVLPRTFWRTWKPVSQLN